MEKAPAQPLPPPSGIAPVSVPTGPSLEGFLRLFHRNRRSQLPDSPVRVPASSPDTTPNLSNPKR